jgi:hypothetical protein
MSIYLDFEAAIAAATRSLLTRAGSRVRPIILLLLALSLIGPAAAYAQTSSTSGMGATSPLGSTSSGMSSPDASVIPLGATELDVRGISPIMSCPGTSSNNAFDGGGVDVLSPGCSSGSQATTGLSGAASNPTTPGLGMGGSSGSNIPLGATGLATPGESQQVNVPSTSVPPCSFSPASVPTMPGSAHLSSSASGC